MQRFFATLTIVFSLFCCTLCLAQSPDTQPTSAPISDVDRLKTLIIGPHSMEIRRRGVVEILKHDPADVQPILLTILTGNDAVAKTAIAAVLADTPRPLPQEHWSALAELAKENDKNAQVAAVSALGANPDGIGIELLSELIRNDSVPADIRCNIIRAMSATPTRPVVGLIRSCLDLPNKAENDAALESLTDVTKIQFGDNANMARQWWKEAQTLSDEEWNRRQLRRLQSYAGSQGANIAQLNNALTSALRSAYQQTSKKDRPKLLKDYLSSSQQIVQQLGVELVQDALTSADPVSEETKQAVRMILACDSPQLREAAIRTITGFRDAKDESRFLQMLSSENQLNVRIALISGLGYVGEAATLPKLLTELDDTNRRVQGETLSAVGRLFERGKVSADQKSVVIPKLLALFNSTSKRDTVLRERALWAMSRVHDPQFLSVFVKAIAPDEAISVRQSALRGLAALDDSSVAVDLVPLAKDTDAALRRKAVETLAKWARPESADAVLKVLFERLGPATESDEAIRRIAWDGCIRILKGRKSAEIASHIEMLPSKNGDRNKRIVVLLEFQEKQLASENADADTRAQISLKLAKLQRELGKTGEAVNAYMRALEQLHRSTSPQATTTAIELLRYSLSKSRYDKSLADRMATLAPPLDGAALWEAVRSDLEKLPPADKPLKAIAILDVLENAPTSTWPKEAVGEYRKSITPPEAPKENEKTLQAAEKPPT